MDIYTRISLAVALVGVLLFSSTMFGVVSPAEPTYLVEFHEVENESISDERISRTDSLPDRVRSRLNTPSGSGDFAVRLDSRVEQPLPEYVRYSDVTYRVQTSHVDPSIGVPYLLAFAGGATLTVTGLVGLTGRIAYRRL